MKQRKEPFEILILIFFGAIGLVIAGFLFYLLLAVGFVAFLAGGWHAVGSTAIVIGSIVGLIVVWRAIRRRLRR